MSPWRRRPRMTRDDAELIRKLPGIGEVNVIEFDQSRITYRDKDLGTVNIMVKQGSGGAMQVTRLPLPPLPDYLKEVIEEQKS